MVVSLRVAVAVASRLVAGVWVVAAVLLPLGEGAVSQAIGRGAYAVCPIRWFLHHVHHLIHHAFKHLGVNGVGCASPHASTSPSGLGVVGSQTGVPLLPATGGVSASAGA